MNRKQAYLALKKTRVLRTDMLEPLKISFETFLSQSKYPNSHVDRCIDRLIKKLDIEFSL